MNKTYKALIQQRADLVREQKALFESGQVLTEAEKTRDDQIVAAITALDADIARAERQRTIERNAPAAPAFNKLPRADNFANAFGHWLKTGDKGGLNQDGFEPVEGGPRGTLEGYTIQAASNATDMNIGTAADGGDTVPTGFYNQIIARRDETMLAAKLPLLKVPGIGTTVDLPYDNEADGEFVTKSEAAAFDLDAPALAKRSLTLVNYTKYTDVSYQLLEDTGANLLAFLSDFVGRGMAKTHNSLLITEAAATGTALKTFASATAIAFGEPEAIVGDNDLSAYLDDEAAVAWVTRSSTLQAIKSIVSTSTRLYEAAVDSGRSLLGYPVYYSQKVAATAASAKDIYFGNWRYMAWREGNGLNFVRDPYTVAINAQVRLLWNFRAVYKQIHAEAIGYGVHPSA